MSHLESHLKPALGATYRIERELGAGGMATVYLAEDIRHHRKVAIKVLHAELAAVIGADRFLAEIRTIASLQHPHILGLIDSGDVEGIPYFVMPFVDGESLRDRRSREKQLPIDDALRLAGEVADALSHAHAHGVIHRDIKPENILLQGGHALVADFGIALAVAGAGGQRLTQTGLSLGTPAYMSPEQAMGEREITARSDIYALGAVTYEMLTGEAPFTGATMQTIIARVITEEPRPIAAQRKSVPPHVEAAVLTALEKLPADRFASAADFARELREPTYRRSADSARTNADSRKLARARLTAPWLIAGFAGAAAIAAMVFAARATSRQRGLENPVFASLDLRDVGMRGMGNDVFAVSPDGRHVAVAVEREGGVGLAVRSLDSLGVRYLARTRGANLPFWSPDGKSVGYFADDSLKVVEVASSIVRPLCRAVEASGGTWNADGTILFSTRFTTLERTSPDGRGCTTLPSSGKTPVKEVRPYFMPDGKHFVATTDMRVWLGRIGGDSLVPLTDLARAEAVFAPPHFLLRFSAASRQIQAQRIDVNRVQLVGEPVTILRGTVNPGGHTGVAASATGVLVATVMRAAPGAREVGNRSGDDADGDLFMQVDRGTNAVVMRQQPAQTWRGLRVSRDGRRFALGGWNIKVAQMTGTAPDVRVAGNVESERETSFDPVWAPGDTAMVYVRYYAAGPKVEVVDLRSGGTKFLFAVPSDLRHFRISDWSNDGRRIAFESAPRESHGKVEAWEYDIRADSARRLFESPVDASEIRYAPSGGWIAYQSTTASESDVFLRPYPGDARPIRVSAGGGRWPRWRADGSELYYVAPDGAVMMVPVRLGTSATLGTPQTLVPATVVRSRRVREFDAEPDGRRFHLLMLNEIAELTLVLNWWGLLERVR